MFCRKNIQKLLNFSNFFIGDISHNNLHSTTPITISSFRLPQQAASSTSKPFQTFAIYHRKKMPRIFLPAVTPNNNALLERPQQKQQQQKQQQQQQQKGTAFDLDDSHFNEQDCSSSSTDSANESSSPDLLHPNNLGINHACQRQQQLSPPQPLELGLGRANAHGSTIRNISSSSSAALKRAHVETHINTGARPVGHVKNTRPRHDHDSASSIMPVECNTIIVGSSSSVVGGSTSKAVADPVGEGPPSSLPFLESSARNGVCRSRDGNDLAEEPVAAAVMAAEPAACGNGTEGTRPFKDGDDESGWSRAGTRSG